jgi:hypothetical protein
MVFQDKYTKEFHIYDWKRVKEISYDSTFNKFAKTKWSHFRHWTLGISLQLNTKAILEAKG